MKNYIYNQKNGELCLDDGEIVGWCYAGCGAGKNNPSLQGEHYVGPLPKGWYTIGQSYTHPKLGPICFNLQPDAENEMFGRGDFRLHADAIKHPGDASKGCIVAPRSTREFVDFNLSKCNRLQVV